MIYASFVVVEVGDGDFAAVRSEGSGRLGCPGGKVETWESTREAAIRECQEEGWYVHVVEKTPFYKDRYNGKPIWWYRGYGAHILDEFVEKGKETPILLSWKELARTGLNNDRMLAKYFDLRYGRL